MIGMWLHSPYFLSPVFTCCVVFTDLYDTDVNFILYDVNKVFGSL